MQIAKIFFASRNQGKISEVKAILRPLDIEVLSISDFPAYEEVDETGDAFLENALLKAEAGLRHSRLPTLAEDAGLEVYALNMEPGIYSSRYGGDISQQEKNTRIIEKVNSAKGSDRTARFHSVVVFLYGDESLPRRITAEGLCYGEIADREHGRNGFGYDPIFLIPELAKTFGELPVEIKNRISHRGNALHAFMKRLGFLIDRQ